jgi:CRISPR-associated endoribonuclease Cas6
VYRAVHAAFNIKLDGDDLAHAARMFQLFTFTDLTPLADDPTHSQWLLASPLDQVLPVLADHWRQTPSFRLGFQSLTVTRVTLQRIPEVERPAVRVRTVSPLVVGARQQSGRWQSYSPSDSEFSHILHTDLVRKDLRFRRLDGLGLDWPPDQRVTLVPEPDVTDAGVRLREMHISRDGTGRFN